MKNEFFLDENLDLFLATPRVISFLEITIS